MSRRRLRTFCPLRSVIANSAWRPRALKATTAGETELGVPVIIARLEDRIFEGLTNGEAKEFPLKFLKSIKVGADLSLVWPKFAVWLPVDKKDGAIRFAKTDAKKGDQ